MSGRQSKVEVSAGMDNLWCSWRRRPACVPKKKNWRCLHSSVYEVGETISRVSFRQTLDSHAPRACRLCRRRCQVVACVGWPRLDDTLLLAMFRVC